MFIHYLSPHFTVAWCLRIVEWFRLEMVSEGRLIQLPAQSTAKLTSKLDLLKLQVNKLKVKQHAQMSTHPFQEGKKLVLCAMVLFC